MATNFDIGIKLRALTQEYLAKIKAAKDSTVQSFRDMGRTSRVGGAEMRESLDQTTVASNKLTNSVRALVARVTAFIGLGVAIAGIKRSFQAVLSTGDQFEKLQVQLEGVMGSIEEGQRATEWIKDFTKNTPFQLDQVAEGFIKLKAFGLDPMDGTYQAIADQAAKLGGSQETLNGITLALGQAWAKQKLQGEEILQLVERGVPVWDLLTEATGKNVGELQKLSEAGKLGRREIKLLIDEIGKSADGQAQKNMSLLSGLVSNLRDTMKEWLDEIADSGVLDYFKGQLSDLSKELQRLRDNGTLTQWAKSVSDTMIAIAENTKSVARTIFNLGGEIKTLALAFAAVKFGAFLQGLAGIATGARAAMGSVVALRGALISTGFGAIAVGIGFVASKLLEMKNASDRAARAEQELKVQAQEVADVYAELSERLGITIQNSRDLIQAEKDGLIVYDEKAKAYVRVTDALDELKEAERDYALDITKTTDAYTIQAQAVTQAARNAIEFADQLDQLKGNAEGLTAALEDLTEQQFQEFSSKLKDAIQTGYLDQADAIEAENLVLQESFRRLGVDTELFRTGLTSAGLEAVAAFDAISNSSQATGSTISTSFTEALEKVETLQGVETLKNRLQQLGQDGKLSAEEVANGMVQITTRIEEINNGLSTTSKIAVDEFLKISRQAEVTGAEIKNSLEKALDNIDSKRAVDQIREELLRLQRDGVITLDELNQRMEELEQKSREVGDAVEVARDKMQELFQAASRARDLDALSSAGIAAAQAWQDGIISAQQYLEAMAEIDAKKAELISKTDQQISKERELASAASATGDSYEKTANQVVAGQERVARANNSAAESMGVSSSALQKAQEEMNAYDSKWRSGRGMGFYKRYSDALQKLAEKHYDQERAAKAGDEAGRKLGNNELGGLRNGLRGATEDTKALADAAKSAANEYQGLEAELAGLEGNQRKVQELQYQQRRAELAAKLADAEAAGNEKAAAAYRRSLATLAEINKIKLDNIKQSEREARLQDNPNAGLARVPAIGPGSQNITSAAGQAQARVVTVAFQAPDGSTVSGQFNEDDTDRLFSVLNQAGASTK